MVSEGKRLGSWKPESGGLRSDFDFDFDFDFEDENEEEEEDEDEDEEEEEDEEGSRSWGMGVMSGGVTEAGSFRSLDFSCWRASAKARRWRRVWRVWDL